MRMIDDIRFWAQVMTDQERTIICPPEYESRLKTMIEARGLSGLLTVLARRECPEDKLLVIDEHAMDASVAQFMARPVTIFEFRPRPRVAADPWGWRWPPGQ